jgi:hypothetical protein
VRALYGDFGPSFAREKLEELHEIRVAKETLRKWMVGAGIWVPRAQRLARAHQPRHRRACFGELVQIDGCEHDWFEGRGPYCTLLVYVDDATGRLMELRFVMAESAFDYFDSTQTYLRRHGKPVAFYSDKHSIFRVHRDGATDRTKGMTQFGRALNELNIEIICANSPQAKGRVERMNKTLQDRLVKELRLRGISTMESGNAFLPDFMVDYNRRFGREPRDPHDAHRPLRADEDLGQIFSWQEERRMTRNLVVHFKRVAYLVEPGPETLSTRVPSSRTSAWAPYWPSFTPPSKSATESAWRRRSSRFARRPASALPHDRPILPRTGHFYLARKRTFLLSFDIRVLPRMRRRVAKTASTSSPALPSAIAPPPPPPDAQAQPLP